LNAHSKKAQLNSVVPHEKPCIDYGVGGTVSRLQKFHIGLELGVLETELVAFTRKNSRRYSAIEANSWGCRQNFYQASGLEAMLSEKDRKSMTRQVGAAETP